MNNIVCLTLTIAAIFVLALFHRLDLLLLLLPLSFLLALAFGCARRRQSITHTRDRKELA